eukprot:GFUD01027757.1.p1 GENE.GFUD01027757.1~~GFUD01027757.1.p1  ORF type:complete len:176 (+),score=35.02 GFUD01027757.1:139-666(+)
MTEEYFYHYTNAEGAKNIFLSGRILPSLTANGDTVHGDTVHGDGVYLTTQEPKQDIEIMGKNNCDGGAKRQEQNMDSYFEIILPSSKEKRSKAKRDIQIYAGALNLVEYKWTLTQYFKVWQQRYKAAQWEETPCVAPLPMTNIQCRKDIGEFQDLKLVCWVCCWGQHGLPQAVQG